MPVLLNAIDGIVDSVIEGDHREHDTFYELLYTTGKNGAISNCIGNFRAVLRSLGIHKVKIYAMDIYKNHKSLTFYFTIVYSQIPFDYSKKYKMEFDYSDDYKSYQYRVKKYYKSKNPELISFSVNIWNVISF